MPRWTFSGVVLPAGERGEVGAGTGEPERLPGEFALPGLVDAHCHLTVTEDEQGPYLGDAALADERLALLARTGVTAVRDVGGRREVTLRLGTSVSSGRPCVFAAGRFFAPRSRYFPRMHDPVEPAELLGAVEGEIAEGAGWIKLIGDFPALGEDGVPIPGTTEVTYSPELVGQVVEAAHRLGARVAVHTNHAVVRDLVAAGIDSVEHGGSLTADDLSALGARHGAWTPTLEASIGWSAAGSGGRSGRRAERSRELCELLPLAVERGVQVLAGSDVVGAVHREVALLVEHGLSVEAALRAATVGGHDYLGSADRGDLVTYERDPRDDPSVLATPAAVVIRGTRIC